MKIMFVRISICFLGFFLSLPLFSLGEKNARPYGFIIKFKAGFSYPDQQQLLSGNSDLQLLGEKENALLPAVSFVKFTSQNISEASIKKLKTGLEKLSEVVFVNVLNSTPGGHFSAPLGEFFVKLNSKNDYPQLESLALETNTRILEEYHYMPGVYILFADKNSKGNSKEMARVFSESGRFVYASSNMFFSLEDCGTNDQFYNRQWAIENTGSQLQFYGTPDADMDADSAWMITSGDSTIKVAVLDSGVDTAHTDLKKNLLPGFDATGNGSNGYPNTNYPEDGHGTCCAGIIAAVANDSIGIAGVAYGCKVIPIKMFYYINLTGTPFPASTNQWGLDAINWAWQTANADVASNSWGIPDSLLDDLQIDTVVSNDAINNAVANGRNGKGLPMLFSAGNEPDTFVLWPARTPATIAVAATTMCDELKTMNDCSPENFWASNHGTGLDISAPGVKIATTDITGNKGFNTGNFYLSFNGTSAACPNAAGVMALILSANKNLSAQKAREIISMSCDKTGAYDYNISAPFGLWSMELGYGRVNAFRALQEALGNNEIKKGEGFDFFVFRDNSGEVLLNYKLPSYSHVTIEIFDVLGRKLKTISEGIKYSGTHQTSIGSGITMSGIYFLRITVGENSYSGKFFCESMHY